MSTRSAKRKRDDLDESGTSGSSFKLSKSDEESVDSSLITELKVITDKVNGIKKDSCDNFTGENSLGSKLVPETFEGRRHVKYNDNAKLKVMRWLKNGETYASVASKMDLSIPTIFSWKRKLLEKTQVITPEGTWEYDGYTKLEACHRLKQGATLELVAEELNVHISVLRKYKSENVFTLTSAQIENDGKYNKEFILNICERLLQGEKGYIIARELGISAVRVYIWKQKYCNSVVSKPLAGSKFDKDTILRACELLKSGERPKDVSRKLQVSTATLLNWRRLYLKEADNKTEFHSFITVFNLVKNLRYHTRKNVLELYKRLNQGESIETVAQKLNVNLMRVQSLRYNYIVKGKSVKATSNYGSGRIIERIDERFRQGVRLRRISREFGINLKTINYWHYKYLEQVSSKFLREQNNGCSWKDVKLESLPIVVLEEDQNIDQLCQTQEIIPFNKPMDETAVKQVCKRLREGATVKTVAEEFGVREDRVKYWRVKFIPKEQRLLRKSRKFSNEEVIKACRLLKQGLSIRFVAKRFGVRESTIKYWRDKVDDSETSNLSETRIVRNDDTVLQACKLLEKGDSVKSVSKIMGVGEQTLYKWRWRYLLSKVQDASSEGSWEYNRYTKLEACHQIKRGISKEDIAKELNIDVNLVGKWEIDCAKNSSLQLMERARSTRVNVQVRQKVGRRDTVSMISRDLGIPYSTIYKYLKQYHQVPIERRGRSKKYDINSESSGGGLVNRVSHRRKQTMSKVFIPLRKIHIPIKMKLNFVRMIEDGVTIEEISRDLNVNKLVVESWILNRHLLIQSLAVQTKSSGFEI